MKKGNVALFVVIFLLVAMTSFVAIFGLNIGNIKINPISENLDLGLDLEGGVYIVLEAQTDAVGEDLQAKMEEAKLIIEERVNGLGVSEPYITIENENRLRVELAGLDDPQEAVELIGRTALLEFKMPNGETVLTGEHLTDAQAGKYGDEFFVSLEFNEEGTELFRQATEELSLAYDPQNIENSTLTIYLDGNVISDPYVKDVIANGKSQISGNFTDVEALNLATALRAGALPVELKEMEISAIGPTLGLESFERSIFAAGIGIALIFLFMIIFYRLPGFVASIALTIYVLAVLSVMVQINAKITLPGIAGLILSIGMAVDANVVIFERIKEEIASGKTARVSVKAGFKRALTSIIDANVTTMIAGGVLYYFGSGMIKGFAVTLIIGLVVSVITAVVITRYLLNLLVSTGKVKNLFGTENPKVFKIDVIKNMRVFMGASIAVIMVGIFSSVFMGLNTGIDFTGGTLIQIDLGKEVPVDEIREISDTLDTDATIVHAGENKEQVIIRTVKSMENEERIEFFNLFKQKYNLSDEDLLNQQKFAPAIGGETVYKAFVSVIIATIGMLIYITLRFEFKFGIAAIIALIHDVLIGLAVFAVLRVPVNSSFIAAMLTIVGYSINDTIVVFDRIRENMSTAKRGAYKEVINDSISQTVRRSLYTSITTLLAIVSLYIFGVESIKEFALPLIIGVIAGTYSSIFIASPVWYLLSTKFSKQHKKIT